MTPAQRCDSTTAPKCPGMVLESCVTRMRFAVAASASTSPSRKPSSEATVAVRKSTSGSFRTSAATMNLVEVGVRLKADHGYEASGVRRLAASFW